MTSRIVVLLGSAVALVAAAPRFETALDRSRAAGAYELLAAIDTGINAFSLAVHTGSPSTNQLPGRVSELSIPISAASRNSCGFAMDGSAPVQWAAVGPFIDFAADTSGLQTPIGRLQDAIERPTSPEDDALIIRIPAVSSAIAGMLDMIVDEGDGGMKGKVRFAVSVSDTTSVRYRVIPNRHNRC